MAAEKNLQPERVPARTGCRLMTEHGDWEYHWPMRNGIWRQEGESLILTIHEDGQITAMIHEDWEDVE